MPRYRGFELSYAHIICSFITTKMAALVHDCCIGLRVILRDAFEQDPMKLAAFFHDCHKACYEYEKV